MKNFLLVVGALLIGCMAGIAAAAVFKPMLPSVDEHFPWIDNFILLATWNPVAMGVLALGMRPRYSLPRFLCVVGANLVLAVLCTGVDAIDIRVLDTAIGRSLTEIVELLGYAWIWIYFTTGSARQDALDDIPTPQAA